MLIFSKGHNSRKGDNSDKKNKKKKQKKQHGSAIFPWGIQIWNFKTLACTLYKIWHALEFIRIFSKGHNSRKRDNSDKKKQKTNNNKKTKKKTTKKKKRVQKNIFPWVIHIWNFKTLACTVLERTDGRTHNPKPICPVNFFEVGRIKTKTGPVYLIFKHSPHGAGDLPSLISLRCLLRGLPRTQAFFAGRTCHLVVVELMFYGPSTLFRSFRARSVYLSTLFLDVGKPPWQFTST